MAVSQKQIAERVGVSIALVSRVLSGKAKEVGIAQATVDRVLAAAEEMGYVPSAAALTLKGKSTRTVGVVVYDFRDPFFGEIIGQLQMQAHEKQYSLVLAGFKSRQPEDSDLAPLHKHAIDGLIIIGSDERADWLNGFSKLPTARIGHGNPDESSVQISVDETDAAQKLVEHLTGAGHKKLVYVGAQLPVHRLRFGCVEKEVIKAGASIAKVMSASGSFEAGRQAVLNLKGEIAAVDALICANDTAAMGALNALHELGVEKPVTGFDDIPAAKQFIPPITTVKQPVEEMARRAFEAVDENTAPETVLLKGLFVRRTSA